MLSMITYKLVSNHETPRIQKRSTHREICWVTCVPATRTSDNRIKAGCQIIREGIHSILGGLVRRVPKQKLSVALA